MTNKDSRNIGKETTRGILGLSHYSFRQKLIYQATKQKNLVIITGESYTSKTSKKTFDCLKCKKKIDKDYNGARNILIRTLTKHCNC